MTCPLLIIHGEKMLKSESEKYLGHIVSTAMNNNELIEKRTNSGTGNVAQIMSFLNSISLAHHYFKRAKILRESILINGMRIDWRISMVQYNRK